MKWQGGLPPSTKINNLWLFIPREFNKLIAVVERYYKIKLIYDYDNNILYMENIIINETV